MLKLRGFTLIELLITLAIIAVLALLIYPSVTTYITKAKRLEAMQKLYQLQLAQEEWRLSHASYANTVEANGLFLPSHTHYRFHINDASGHYYQLFATANNPSSQQADKEGAIACHTLSLDRNDIKTPASCWE